MTDYYRNVIEVEILSDEPWTHGTDLADINYQITEGHSSGRITHTVTNQRVDAETMRPGLPGA